MSSSENASKWVVCRGRIIPLNLCEVNCPAATNSCVVCRNCVTTCGPELHAVCLMSSDLPQLASSNPSQSRTRWYTGLQVIAKMDAQSVFHKMLQTYADCVSYQDNGIVHSEGKFKKIVFETRFARPDRFRFGWHVELLGTIVPTSFGTVWMSKEGAFLKCSRPG
jgi:hypothetical protein